MPKFYVTFGRDQPNPGCVLPILAEDEDQVRSYMVYMYNGKWCGTYTQEHWNDWLNRKPSYIKDEFELPEIDIRKNKEN